jgi:uncharacterized protein YihD (DUF1040 family)
MKKAKAALKKSNNIKTKPKAKVKGSPIVGRMKTLAKGIVQAMSPKSGKKPQVKAAPKAASKAAAKPSKAPAPAPKKLEAAKKPLPAVAAKKDSGKSAKLPKEVAVETKKITPAPVANVVLAKGKVPPTKPAATMAAAVLTKGKGKAEPKAKAGKMTAAQLAEHLEKMCRETGCENLSSTKGYCRLDYIKNWKKIKRKEMILKEGKLNQYIEELVNKYPEKYIDVIRQDLSTEVNFNKVIHDLELDESIDDLDYDGDSIDALIGGIKKEAEDFGGDDEF